MCNDCHPQGLTHYEGKRVVIEPGVCVCDDCKIVDFTATGSRCSKCGCLMDTQLTDDQEPFDNIWIDPMTKHPVKL